jgi:hypothetical protein
MKKQTSTAVARFRRRLSSRGAAMVEASIVVFTCLVFWGTIRVVHSANAGKLELMQVTRNNAFSLAAKNCEGGDKASTVANAQVDTSTVDNGAAVAVDSAVNPGVGGDVANSVDQTGAPSSPGAVAGPGKSSFIASSIAEPRSLRNTFKKSDVWPPTDEVFSATVGAKSFVACNEKPQGGSPIDFINYVVQNIETFQDALELYAQ